MPTSARPHTSQALAPFCLWQRPSAQADAIENRSAGKAPPCRRIRAAQERGEVAKHGETLRTGPDVPKRSVGRATAADVGLSRKEIHEARTIRDAERRDPGVVRGTVGGSPRFWAGNARHCWAEGDFLRRRRPSLSSQRDLTPAQRAKLTAQRKGAPIRKRIRKRSRTARQGCRKRQWEGRQLGGLAKLREG
jgi:hypothetical protein